jgi:hypothetical protein
LIVEGGFRIASCAAAAQMGRCGFEGRSGQRAAVCFDIIKG